MIGSLSRIGRSKTSPDIAPASTHLQVRKSGSRQLISGFPDSTMHANNQIEAFRGTIYAATDKIARRMAQMPIHLFQMQLAAGKVPEKTELHSHPFLTLFSSYNGRKPHEHFSVWELDYWTSVSMDLTGEAFWLVERDKYGKPSRVTPLPSNRMQVLVNEEGMITGYLFVPEGCVPDDGIFIPHFSMEELRTRDRITTPFVVHHRNPSPRGIEDLRGWSPVKAAAYAYDINLFEQIYKSNFLQQGAQLGGILQSDTALSKDQIEEYLDQFESRHRGVRKAGLPMILPKMLKWTTTEPTPRDIQWIEALAATESQMLQIYGISDAKLGRADIGNRSTAEAMDVTFNREVIQSRLDVKVSKLNSDFLPIYPGQTDYLYFCAEFDSPIPADNEMALKQEDQDLKNMVITRNEVRAKRKLKPMGKIGDAVWAQSNNTFFDANAPELENALQPGAMDEFAAEQKKAVDKAKQDQLDAAGADAEPYDDDPTPPPKRSLKRDNLTNAIGASIAAHMDTGSDATMMAEISVSLENLMREEIDNASDLIGGVPVDREDIIREYMVALERQITGINATTAAQVREVILQGIADGENVNQIAREIESIFDFADTVRSLTIARTTVLGAMNFAAFETYSRGGVDNKGWLSTMDDRVRDTHAEANGQVVAIDEKFRVGNAELAFPGDPNGPANEVISCRCTLTPENGARSVAERDAIWQRFDKSATVAEKEVRAGLRKEFQRQREYVLNSLRK